ncbi:hypothetical protein [Pseudactinotalea sp. Z1748]
MSLTPVYSFPLLDDDLDVLGTERRIRPRRGGSLDAGDERA